jgi:diguanylate cyclase (GGDEF)-like protein
MLSVFSFFSPFTKEALDSCREDILRHNIRSLLIISFVTTILIGLFMFFPVLVEKQMSKFFGYLVTVTVEFVVVLYSFFLFKRDKCSSLLAKAGFLFFYISLIAFGIFLEGFKQPYEHISIVLVFFVSAQILFVVDLLQSLTLNLITVIVFSFFCINTKPFEVWVVDAVSITIAALVCMVITRYMYYTIIRGMIAARRLEIERNRFREESIKDELTGLSNRRDYFHAVNFYISVCQHVHQTVCAIMMDVDFFKKYNDFYGHSKGDFVLQSIGKVLQSLVVEERVFSARVGGEEFIVLWTENRISEAERVAVKLRQKIIDLQIPHEKSTVAPYVTASLGLYILRGGSADSVEDLYNNTDIALYEAKNRGRNCVVLRDSADKTMRPVDILLTEKNIARR